MGTADDIGSDVSRKQTGLLLVLALVAVIPELAFDTTLAWYNGQRTGLDQAILAMSATAGGSQTIVGLAWPAALILLWLRNGGRRLALGMGHRAALWFILLATLYALTIYLRGSITVLDTSVLLLLFGAYVWTMFWHRPTTGSVDNDQSSSLRAIAVVTVVASASLATIPLAEWLLPEMTSAAGESFLPNLWTAPFLWKAPLIIAASALVWTSREHRAAALLLSTQVCLLTVVLGSLPLAFTLNSLGAGALEGFPLEEEQRTQLLLTAAQSLFLIVVLARMTVGLKGATALLVTFVLQVLLRVFIGPQSAAAPVAVYLGAALVMLVVDRERLDLLLELVPAQMRTGRRAEARPPGSGLRERGFGLGPQLDYERVDSLSDQTRQSFLRQRPGEGDWTTRRLCARRSACSSPTSRE